MDISTKASLRKVGRVDNADYGMSDEDDGLEESKELPADDPTAVPPDLQTDFPAEEGEESY